MFPTSSYTIEQSARVRAAFAALVPECASFQAEARRAVMARNDEARFAVVARERASDENWGAFFGAIKSAIMAPCAPLCSYGYEPGYGWGESAPDKGTIVSWPRERATNVP